MDELEYSGEDAVILITALNQLKAQLGKFDKDKEYMHLRQFMDKDVDSKIDNLIDKLAGGKVSS